MKVNGNTLKKGDIVVIKPTLSKTGRYGKYLNRKAKVINPRKNRWDQNCAIEFLHNNEVMKNVGYQSLLMDTESTQERIRDEMKIRFEKLLVENQMKITDLKKENILVEAKIKYIEEEKPEVFRLKDFHLWYVALLIEDDSLNLSKKAKLIVEGLTS